MTVGNVRLRSKEAARDPSGASQKAQKKEGGNIDPCVEFAEPRNTPGKRAGILVTFQVTPPTFCLFYDPASYRTFSLKIAAETLPKNWTVS